MASAETSGATGRLDKLASMGTYRKIDVEHPSPAGIRYNDTPDPRSKSDTNRVDGQYHGDVIPPFSQGHEIRDDNVNNDIHTTRANALYGSPGNQHGSVRCTAADAAPEGEEGDNHKGDPSSAPNVGELPKQRLDRSSVGWN